MIRPLLSILTLLVIFAGRPVASGAADGELDLTVIDAETKLPIAARLRIEDHRGRPPKIRNVPRLGNEFTFRDTLTFKLKRGKYQFSLEHGPQYKRQAGVLQVDRDGFDQKTIVLPRFANLMKKGFYSGDLYCERDTEQLDLLMDAEELNLLIRPSWTPGVAFNQYTAKRIRSIADDQEAKRVQDHSAGLLQIDGGRLLFTHLKSSDIRPENFLNSSFEAASHARTLPGAHVALLDPWAWDLPMLVAHGLIDSISVLGDEIVASNPKRRKALSRGGFPPQGERFEGPHGTGQWAEHIYFQLLNCGLRIAPAAHSGSGPTNNPIGFNRVYVACGADFSPSSWYENLRKGKCLVSNGPVLSVRVNDELPGHVFKGDDKVVLEVTCELATRQKVEYLEIIKDGRVQESVRLDKWAAAGGVLPLISFEESGWMLVRAYAAGEENYRCAISAPFYVEIGDQVRISKTSAAFFGGWVLQRAKRLRQMKLSKTELKQKLQQQKAAYEFWKSLASKSTSD